MKTITTIIFLLIAGNAFGQGFYSPNQITTNANYSAGIGFHHETGIALSATYDNKLAHVNAGFVIGEKYNAYAGFGTSFLTDIDDFKLVLGTGYSLDFMRVSVNYNFSYIKKESYPSLNLWFYFL